MSSIALRSNGSISGIDGMLDQVAGAVAKQVRTHILPVVQQDRELQRNLARGLGEGLGDKLSPAATVAAVGLLLLGGCYAYKTFGGTPARRTR